MTDPKSASFFVAGEPATAGSKRGFPNRKTGGVVIAPANSKKQKTWMAHVRAAAQEKCYQPDYRGPVTLVLRFFFMRPKIHFGTGKNATKIKDSSPDQHLKKPDCTKLLRAVEDALAKVAFYDDSQVVSLQVSKEWAKKEGVFINVTYGANHPTLT